MAFRRTASLLVALVLGVGMAACTSDEPASDPPPTSASTTVAATSSAPATEPALDRSNAPFKAVVVKVTGTMSKRDRHRLKRLLAAPVARWMDAAFFRGPYPRSDFSSAFTSWTRSAAQLARRDSEVTTNAELGPDLVDVVADERVARMFLFAVDGAAGGATAGVRLRLTGERRDGSLVHTAVSGRLYLTKLPGSGGPGRWRVFGYDLSRTGTPQ